MDDMERDAIVGLEPALQPLREIGEVLRTQDNRATRHPVFVVQQKRRIYGLDPEYSENPVWIDGCNDGALADEGEAEELEAKYQRGEKIDGCWYRTSYIDIWEFVTACFTEQGCKDYLAANGHNLTDPRIYVDSAHRNAEWQTMRTFLMGLAPITDTGDTPREGS